MIFDREGRNEIDSPSKDVDVVCAERPSAKVETWAARRIKMTLNQFSFFATAAKHLSLTKASAELRVSQPSITQQLKQLENYYGAKLYRRTSKGIEITEAGRLLVRKITPILEQVAELGEGSRPVPARVMREFLAVGGTFSASALLLPKLLARLQARHPNAEIEFQTSSSEHLERLVVKGAMDLALIDRKPASQQLTCESLQRERVLFFVHATHRLADQQTLKMADVLAGPLIIRGGKGISGTTERALKRLQEQGWAVRVGMRCEGPSGIIAAVRQKMGVGIAFEDSIRAESDGGEFKVLDVPGLKIEAQSFIVYLKNRELSPLAQELLDLLRGERAQAEKLRRASRRAMPGKRRGESPSVKRPVAVL